MVLSRWKKTLKQYWVWFGVFFWLVFFDSLFIPKIQMSCGGGDRLHVSSYLSSTVPGATVQRG